MSDTTTADAGPSFPTDPAYVDPAASHADPTGLVRDEDPIPGAVA